jgi:hypothetical protein
MDLSAKSQLRRVSASHFLTRRRSSSFSEARRCPPDYREESVVARVNSISRYELSHSTRSYPHRRVDRRPAWRHQSRLGGRTSRRNVRPAPGRDGRCTVVRPASVPQCPPLYLSRQYHPYRSRLRLPRRSRRSVTPSKLWVLQSSSSPVPYTATTATTPHRISGGSGFETLWTPTYVPRVPARISFRTLGVRRHHRYLHITEGVSPVSPPTPRLSEPDGASSSRLRFQEPTVVSG